MKNLMTLVLLICSTLICANENLVEELNEKFVGTYRSRNCSIEIKEGFADYYKEITVVKNDKIVFFEHMHVATFAENMTETREGHEFYLEDEIGSDGFEDQYIKFRMDVGVSDDSNGEEEFSVTALNLRVRTVSLLPPFVRTKRVKCSNMKRD